MNIIILQLFKNKTNIYMYNEDGNSQMIKYPTNSGLFVLSFEMPTSTLVLGKCWGHLLTTNFSNVIDQFVSPCSPSHSHSCPSFNIFAMMNASCTRPSMSTPMSTWIGQVVPLSKTCHYEAHIFKLAHHSSSLKSYGSLWKNNCNVITM